MCSAAAKELERPAQAGGANSAGSWHIHLIPAFPCGAVLFALCPGGNSAYFCLAVAHRLGGAGCRKEE